MEDEQRPLTLDLRDLQAVSVLGRGAKGVAFLVLRGGERLALKTISRTPIDRKDSGDGYRRVWFERDVLDTLDHPLLPKLRGTVVTEKIIGFALPFCSGGDLSSLRRSQTEKMFSDDIIRFYAAELVLALEYLHGLGFVYRDLKPENILIQESGHIMLVDFDLSAKFSTPESTRRVSPKGGECITRTPSRKRRFHLPFRSCLSPEISVAPAENNSTSSADSSSEKSNSFVGTEDYIAPEMILGKGHDFAADWWSLGVVLYEMLYGRTPFRGSNRKETFYRILTKAPDLVGEATALRDLIKRLLQKDPAERISLEGIKEHPFFRGVKWESVMMIPRPPFVPAAEGAETAVDMLGVDVEEFVQSVFGGGENENQCEMEKRGATVDDLVADAPRNNEFLIF